jgi:hypothetical protein
VDGGEDATPADGHVGWRRAWPADGAQDAFLPGLALGDVRPGTQADRRRPDGGPDVDEGVADDEDVLRAGCLGRDAALLGAGNQVVDQDAELAAGGGLEVLDDRGEVVDALQVLHSDGDVAQVIAPDLLDEFGVVLALNIDAAGPRDLGPLGGGGDRAGRGLARAGRDGGLRLHERDPLAVEQEASGDGEDAALAVPVLQGHRAGVERDDRAAEPALEVLDHQARLRLDGRDRALPGLRLPVLSCQDVGRVPFALHRSSWINGISAPVRLPREMLRMASSPRCRERLPVARTAQSDALPAVLLAHASWAHDHVTTTPRRDDVSRYVRMSSCRARIGRKRVTSQPRSGIQLAVKALECQGCYGR